MKVEYKENGCGGFHWYYTDGTFDGWSETEESASLALAVAMQNKKKKKKKK